MLLTVGGVVLLDISVGVARVDGAILLDVHEGVEDVGDLVGGKISRLEVAAVDAPRVASSQYKSRRVEEYGECKTNQLVK